MSLVLLNLRVGPFAGIGVDRPVVVKFPAVSSKITKRSIIKLTGDQGLGKSSFIHFLLLATAQKFGMKKEDLVNLQSGEISGEMEFLQKGEKWKVVVTTDTFKLYRFFEVEDDAGWIPQGDEEKTLKMLIGNIGMSPVKLKTDDGQKQVDWLFKMLNVPEDVIVKAQTISSQLSDLSKARAKANREYLFLKKSLSENPLYLDWEDSEKKFKEAKTVDGIRDQLRIAEQNKGKLDAARQKLTSIGDQILGKQQDIDDLNMISGKQPENGELKDKIRSMEKDLKKLQTNKGVAEKFIRDNAKVEEAYGRIHGQFLTVNEYIGAYAEWQKIKQSSKEMQEFETIVQQCDTKKLQLRTKRRDLLRDIVDLDGLEIVTEDEIDGKKVGVYLDGKNPNQLSDSELFDLYFALCQAHGVTMIIVENIGGLGSKVVKTLNAFAKAGIYVWGTEMKRDQQQLQVEFIDQIK